jgi:2-oxoglutarate dehydrogenase E1 component
MKLAFMKDFSYITNSHPAYIENLYKEYTQDPNSVDPEMKKFFDGFDFAVTSGKASSNGGPATAEPGIAPSADWKREIGVYRMILGFRNKGHLIADTNPIRKRKDRGANLDLAFFGFKEEDLDKTFQAGTLIGLGPTTLRNIIDHLKKWYAGHVGIEFKYMSEQKKVDWITNE